MILVLILVLSLKFEGLKDNFDWCAVCHGRPLLVIAGPSSQLHFFPFRKFHKHSHINSQSNSTIPGSLSSANQLVLYFSLSFALSAMTVAFGLPDTHGERDICSISAHNDRLIAYTTAASSSTKAMRPVDMAVER
jgi:hypothetical protein